MAHAGSTLSSAPNSHGREVSKCQTAQSNIPGPDSTVLSEGRRRTPHLQQARQVILIELHCKSPVLKFQLQPFQWHPLPLPTSPLQMQWSRHWITLPWVCLANFYPPSQTGLTEPSSGHAKHRLHSRYNRDWDSFLIPLTSEQQESFVLFCFKSPLPPWHTVGPQMLLTIFWINEQMHKLWANPKWRTGSVHLQKTFHYPRTIHQKRG